MQFNDRLNICVDFDGTIVRHRHPDIGPEAPGAFAALRQMQDAGVKLILFTLRGGADLDAAVAFCAERGIHFFDVNANRDQLAWSDGKKVFGHVYIDDLAVGCPLVEDPGHPPYVDWPAVMALLAAAPQPR